MFGQLPERGAKCWVPWDRGVAGLLGSVFAPGAAVATPAPIATVAVVPAIASRYLRLRIEILPSVLGTVI
jgi:hypothetical protein